MIKVSIEKTLTVLKREGIDTDAEWFKKWFTAMDTNQKQKQLKIICKNYNVEPVFYQTFV